MKQLVVAGIAVVASLVGGTSYAAAPANGRTHGSAELASITHAIAADRSQMTLAQALAFDRDAPLEAPSFAARKKKPDILNNKCSFNGSRNLFRLRRTECRMV